MKHIINIFEEISILFLLITLPFIGIQSIGNFVLPYNLIFFLGVFVFYVLRVFYFLSPGKKSEVSLNNGQILLLLFLFSNFISFLFSKYPYGNKIEFSQITAYVCLAFAFAGKEKDTSFNKLFWLLLGLGFLQSAYSLLQVLGIDFLNWSVNFGSRGFGTLVNPNHFAGYLVLIFPLSLYYFCSKGSKITKSVSGIFLVFIVSGIIISSSQGGILALGLSCAFFLYVSIKNNILKKEDRINLIITAFIIIILNGFLYTVTRDKRESLSTRVSQIMEEENPSIEGRLLNWSGTLLMIREKPFLGWGPGTYKDVFIKYRPLEFNKFEPAEHPRLYAHNDFLQVISELGLSGFCFFVFLLIVLFRNINKSLKKENPLFYLTLGSIVIAGLVAGFFNTAFTFHYFIMPSASLFWMVLGMGLKESTFEGPVVFKNKIKPAYFILLPFLFWGLFYQIRSYRGKSWNLKADRNLSRGLTDNAVNNLRQATYIDGENDMYRYSLSMQYLGSFFRTKGGEYLTLAREEMREAIKLNPFSGIYHYQMAQIYLNESPAALEKSIDEELNKAVELDPSYVRIYLLKAEWATEKQDLNEAIKIYKHIYEIEQGDKTNGYFSKNPNILSVYNFMGRFYYEKKNLQKSVYFYEKLITHLPEKGALFNNLGALYLEMKDYKMAEEYFNKAISLEPENIEFHKNLAYTYKVNNEPDKYDLKMKEIKEIINSSRGQDDTRSNKKGSRKK
ncbi:MAG: O-antigen ligase family protein [bacterium]|nr:O-antigen ligase family protein [bacterium]